MFNSSKAVVKIVAIFAFLILTCAVGAKLFFKTDPSASLDDNPDATENSVVTGDLRRAQADFRQNGLKGMWISYLEYQNLDFSSRQAFTQDIRKVFADCKAMGLNTVIVHARAFGDAFYPSSYFPYSHIITGSQGTDPGYDPLAIMVETAHKTGLRIEAWVNPYRVKLGSSMPKELSADNPAQNTALTITTDSGIFYNPALEEVRDLVTAGVVEIVENYDVDGIHFDDYFYPDTSEEIDSRQYRRYEGDMSLEDWRRENVNMLIRQVYGAVKQADDSVTFGISPQGNDDNNYNMQYSDVALWLSQPGYADYIMPQLYWGFNYTTASGSDRYAFKNLSYDWSEYERTAGVKLYVGLGAYRIGDGDGSAAASSEWQTGDNLKKMLEVIDANPNLDGYAIYSYNSLFNNTKYSDLARQEVQGITDYNK